MLMLKFGVFAVFFVLPFCFPRIHPSLSFVSKSLPGEFCGGRFGRSGDLWRLERHRAQGVMTV